MKILVACEYSGIVRNSFVKLGHKAISCDILPSETPGEHIQDNIYNVNLKKFDLLIAFPPCTYLTVSGARWFYDKRYPDRFNKQKESLKLVKYLLNAPVEKICIENPIGAISTKIKKPTQIIQPYYFGDKVSKSTCLWLKNLPKLKPTKLVNPNWVYMKNGKRMSEFFYNSFKLTDRSKYRSKTFPGIAKAMANQWGKKKINSYQISYSI